MDRKFDFKEFFKETKNMIYGIGSWLFRKIILKRKDTESISRRIGQSKQN